MAEKEEEVCSLTVLTVPCRAWCYRAVNAKDEDFIYLCLYIYMSTLKMSGFALLQSHKSITLNITTCIHYDLWLAVCPLHVYIMMIYVL